MSSEKLADDKINASIRINKDVLELYKKYEIPLSMVSEAGMIHFLSLSDDEKINYINKNQPGKVNPETLHKSRLKWKEILSQRLKQLNVDSATSMPFLMGAGLGAVALIGGILAAATVLFKNKEE